jgi:dephospho-CoA kinase
MPSPAVTVGLIAHDAKKDELARFMRAHRSMIGGLRFLAPEDRARAVTELMLAIEVLAPDTLGGDLQVAAAVVDGRVDAVIFLHDPLAALPSEPSLGNLLKVCDLKPIPIATNVAAAELIIHRLAEVLEADTTHPRNGQSFERALVLTGPWSDGEDPMSRPR